MATPRRSETKEKKRALPTEFERQVAQIRTDITTVRANLQRAESALASVPPTATEAVGGGAGSAAPTSGGGAGAVGVSGSMPGSASAAGALSGAQARSTGGDASAGADMLAEVLVSDGNAAAAAAAAAGVKQEVQEEKTFTG